MPSISDGYQSFMEYPTRWSAIVESVNWPIQSKTKDIFCTSVSKPPPRCKMPWDPVQQYECEKEQPVQKDFVLFKYLDDDADGKKNDILLYNFDVHESYMTSGTVQITCYNVKTHPTGTNL